MGQDGVGNRGNAQKVRKQDQDHDRNEEHKDEGQGMNKERMWGIGGVSLVEGGPGGERDGQGC